jgi:hypothetical protein
VAVNGREAPTPRQTIFVSLNPHRWKPEPADLNAA